jgi:hypothetical protein
LVNKKVIKMGMQTLGNSAKKSLAKEGAIILRHLTKLVFSAGKDNSCTPCSTETLQTSEQPEQINPQTYLAENTRMHEIETEKAMIMIAMRHESWKAGGPI